MLRYAAEPEILIEQLRKDEAIAEADTFPKIRPGSVTALPKKNRFSGRVDREGDSNPMRI